jgi:hypothetical protein
MERKDKELAAQLIRYETVVAGGKSLKIVRLLLLAIFKIIMRKLLADSTEYGVSGDDPRGDRNTKGRFEIQC